MSSTAASSLGSMLPANIMANGGGKTSSKAMMELKPTVAGGAAGKGHGKLLPGSGDKHESWQMELLMERLRNKAKSSQYKSFQEMSKAVRMSLLEKRYALDAVEKSNLQKTLDSMQYCIKVTSRQGLVERLDCLTRQLGLKLSEDTSGLFISSDMFYLEIILDPNGTVQDVKVHHECKMKQQSCSELVSCLQRGDFVDFTTQLEGLASIYQLNAEKKIKVNAFVALQALETDLYYLYTLSTQHYTDIHSLLLKSPLGVVQKRRGGHAMKLTYYIAPHDLLDLEAKKEKPLNTELISTEKIGYSVAVNLEASTANKVQIQPLLVQQGNSPVYSPIEKHNSTSLPATFVLRLNKPMALNVAMLKQIKLITGDGSTATNDSSPASNTDLISLIVQHASNGTVNNITRGLFVALPDQYHCYYMTECKNLKGTIISSIPFTEPQHVSKILVFLRQQALFNQLLTSCIRNNGSSSTRVTDYEHLVVFEVAALSCQYITVSLEHPFEESLAMVEFDLSNVLSIQVRVFCNGYESDERLSKRVSAIVQRTMSIPVTLWRLMKIWQEEYEVKFKGQGTGGQGNGTVDEGNFSLSMGPDEGGGNGPAGPGGGGGGTAMNGQMSGNLNGTGMVHQEFCDVKKVKLEPMDPSKKRRTVEDFCKSPKSSKVESEEGDQEMDEEDDDDEYDESTNLSSGDSNSLGENQQTNAGQSSSSTAAMGAPAPVSSVGPRNTISGNGSESSGNSSILGGLDFSSLDPDLMRSSNSSDLDDTAEASEPEIKVKSEEPNYATSVSITPIGVVKSSGSLSNSALNNIGLDKRPGIEIIPLATAGTNIPSSITITPIPMGTSGGSLKSSTGDSGSSDKKLSVSSSGSIHRKSGSSSSSSTSESDRAKLEKKKKRRHEEQLAQLQQMGPPHKILSKSSDGPGSPSGSSRKFSVSPVPLKSGSGSSSSSQIFLSGGSPGSGSKSSPKHSPVHHSSPKHQSSSYGTSSPKHISGGGSGGGKPSMSALKSATSSGSPSSKSSTSGGNPAAGKEECSSGASGTKSSGSGGSSSSRDRDRDRDRERSEKKSGYSSSSSSSSPKLKSPAVKLKQLDLANCGSALSAGVQLELMNSNSSGGSSSGSGSLDLTDSGLFGIGAADLSKNSSAAAASAAGMLLLQQAMKRKGSLSAVIDKLKSAQGGDESSLMLLPELAQQAGFALKESGKSVSSAPSSSAPTSSTSSASVSNHLPGGVSINPASSAAAAALAAHFSSAAAVAAMQAKNSEYMVKPSSDGIKLTIQNKKGSKSGSSGGSSSSSSSSASKSSSKSGTKPPSISGGSMPPKKLPSSQSFSGTYPPTTGSSSSSSGKSLSSGSSSKAPFQKSSSSGSLSSSGNSTMRPSSKSGSSSSSGGGSSSSKDKSRSSSKSSSSSSAAAASLMATNVAMAAAAQAAVNANALNVMKMLGLTSSIQNMEGFVKTLDTKFQIPKLSARSSGGGSSGSGHAGGSDIEKLKQESRPSSSSAPTTPLSNVAQSPTGGNDFSLPFNKLPGDVSPLHSAMLPNVMQKMFPGHDSSMLMRRSPNLDHQSSGNSRDGFSSIYGKGSTTPTTPTGSVPPPFPSPVGMQSHAMDFSNSSDSADASLMRPPSRPSSTMSNHSSSDKLIDATTNSNSMDGLRSTSPAQALAVAAQLINKLDHTQQFVAALKNHHHHLSALSLSNAAAVAAAAASASGGSAGPGPVTSPTSVSVHIMKSPVPSPLPLHGAVAPDEDDTLVGFSGK
ncbi:hypothetical protein RP20_CCG021633 [Aedes albopictus]|nr:hypothetical protein RP20_CCG021633 [Aedes albopictus]